MEHTTNSNEETPPMSSTQSVTSNGNSAHFTASSVTLHLVSRGNEQEGRVEQPVNRRKSSNRRHLKSNLATLCTAQNLYKALIVLGSFIVYFIADGVSLSFGIFTRELVNHFNKKDDVSSVFITTGLLQAVPLFLSPLVCHLIKRYSFRSITLAGATFLVLSFVLTRFFVNSLLTLNLIFGLMTSVGLAMIYIPAYLIISFYFDERRALATGIAVSGSGLGLFVLSPVSEFLIDHFGWKDAILIFSAINSHVFISALLFRSNPDIQVESEQKKTDEKEIDRARNSQVKLKIIKKSPSEQAKSLLQELRFIYSSTNYLLITISYFVLSFSIITPHNFLPSHIELREGQLDDPSSISISMLGISTLVGQIVLGFVADLFRAQNWLIFSICLILAGLITLVFPFITSIYLVYVYSVLFGFLTSVNYVLQSTLVIESGVGMDRLTLAFGCLQLIQGFSVLFGTPFLSYVKDLTGNYDKTFYLAGASIAAAGLIMLAWPLFARNDHSDDDDTTSNKSQTATDNQKSQTPENMRLTVCTDIL